MILLSAAQYLHLCTRLIKVCCNLYSYAAWCCWGTGAEDGTALEMAFSRKKIEERKAWLRGFLPGTYLDHTASDISYTDFVNKARGCICLSISGTFV